MKLHAVEPARLVGHGGHGAVRGVRDGRKALRRTRHLIGVAHPAGAARPEPRQQPAFHPVHGHLGAAVFAPRAAFHRRAQKVGHQLHAVADAQNRHAQRKHALIHRGRALVKHAGRAAAEDDAHGPRCPDIRQRRAAGQHAGIDPVLAHPPGDQLGILSAKIQNQNALRSFHWFTFLPALGCREQKPGATRPILPQNGAARKGGGGIRRKNHLPVPVDLACIWMFGAYRRSFIPSV